MTAVVVPPALLLSNPISSWPAPALWPVIGLALVTFLSRLSLFTGVKFLGGLDTALIGLGEIVVTLILALLWLGESLTFGQWLGALLLAASIMLLPFDQRTRQAPPIGGWLRWLLPRARYQPDELPESEGSATTRSQAGEH